MINITNPNSERIDKIHTFLQGSNPIGLGEDSVKAVLACEEACSDMVSTEQTKRLRAKSTPTLATPNMGFNASASVVEAFVSLRQILNNSTIEGLRDTLKLLNAESESRSKKGNDLLDSFAQTTDALSNTKIEFDELTNQLNVKNSNVDFLNGEYDTLIKQSDANQQKLQTLNNALGETKAKLNILLAPTTSDEKAQFTQLTQQKNQLEADVNYLNTQQLSLKTQCSTLQANITNCQKEIIVLEHQYKKVTNQVTELAKTADSQRETLNQFVAESSKPIEIDGEKWESTLALLTMLTASLKKAMNEDSIRNMKEQEEVMNTISKASRKDSEAKAKEAEEAQRKADEANKAASCASKIFSYVMLAVSVIATVATFGAAAPLAIAVAAIGIAISVADIVLEETGQSSLRQMLATEISSVVTDMLITFGVPEEKAKQIGSIVGMIVAAIAFLALSLASMSSFVKNIANVATNAVKMLAKNAGTLLKSIIKSMPSSLTNALGNIANGAGKVGKSADDMVVLTKFTKLADSIDDLQQAVKTTTKVAQKADDMKDIVKAADKVADQADNITDATKTADKAINSVKTQSVAAARLEVGMKGTGAVLTVANTATSGGLNLHAAGQIRDMKEMLAGMMLNSETIQALDELLKNLLKSMSQNYEQFEEMFSGMLTSLNQSGQAKANMLKTARFA